MEGNIKEILESLSPIERKIMPYLKEGFENILKKSELDRVSVLRALEFLNTKGIIKLQINRKKIVELGTNGIFYKKKGLPERQLLHLIEKKNYNLEEAQKESKLSQNEFKAALGALKKKTMIELRNGRIMLNASKNEISKKTLEESFIDELPIEYEKLKPEQMFALNALKDRKEIVEVSDEQIITEELTSEMIKTGSWKGKKFRRYDVVSPVPRVYGGKRHFETTSYLLNFLPF